jgi:hypothetical protein
VSRLSPPLADVLGLARSRFATARRGQGIDASQPTVSVPRPRGKVLPCGRPSRFTAQPSPTSRDVARERARRQKDHTAEPPRPGSRAAVQRLDKPVRERDTCSWNPRSSIVTATTSPRAQVCADRRGTKPKRANSCPRKSRRGDWTRERALVASDQGRGRALASDVDRARSRTILDDRRVLASGPVPAPAGYHREKTCQPDGEQQKYGNPSGHSRHLLRGTSSAYRLTGFEKPLSRREQRGRPPRLTRWSDDLSGALAGSGVSLAGLSSQSLAAAYCGRPVGR